MLRKNEAKTTALILTAVCLSLSLFVSWTSFNLSMVGICKDCSILARIAYSFFHASIPHAIINCWCILSIVFIYNTSLTELFTSYMIAATYPVNTICYVCGNYIAATTPTVGLSAICFALLGMTAFLTISCVDHFLYYSLLHTPLPLFSMWLCHSRTQ